jgi:hypothetical protein
MKASKKMLSFVLKRLRAGVTVQQVAQKLTWSSRIIERAEAEPPTANIDQVVLAYGQAVDELAKEGGPGEPILGRLANNLLANHVLLTSNEFIAVQGHFLKHNGDSSVPMNLSDSSVFWDKTFDPNPWMNGPFGQEIQRRAENSGHNLALSAHQATTAAIRFDDLFGIEDIVTVRIKRGTDMTGTTTLSFERIGS